LGAPGFNCKVVPLQEVVGPDRRTAAAASAAEKMCRKKKDEK